MTSYFEVTDKIKTQSGNIVANDFNLRNVWIYLVDAESHWKDKHTMKNSKYLKSNFLPFPSNVAKASTLLE